MLKTLKVALIVYAVLGIITGLAYLFAPGEFLSMFGFEEISAHLYAFVATLGASFIAACVFLIISVRDIARNILWAKFAILFAALQLVAELYSTVRGYIDFSQSGTPIIIHAVFAVAFLIFYPWRRTED